MSLKNLVLSVVVAVAAIASATAAAQPTPLDGIAAVVNDDVILRSELDRRTLNIQQTLARSGGGLPPMDVLRRQVLERLILDRLQLQRAEQVGITVSEDRLNQAVSGIARSNGMTLDEFAAALTADGLDFAAVREDVRADMIMNQLRQREVLARVHVTQREVENFLAGEGAGALDDREFDVQHIMLRADPEAPAAESERVRALADDIVRRARAGEDFGALAVEYSAGQQALEGGSLGWRRSTQLPAAFAQRVVGLRAGEVSDVIRTPGALHILKLNATRGGGERVVVQQTRARHILIRTNPVLTDARAAARLEELRAELVAGGDFSLLARRHSEDPGSAVNGGELDWLGPGQTVPAFEAAMNALEVGEISEPFASEYGWHIVQVLDRRTHDDTEQLRAAQARQIVGERKAEEQMQDWLMRMRDDAYVENRLDG